VLQTSSVTFIVKITADRTQLSDVHVRTIYVNIERFKSKLGPAPTVTVSVSFVASLQSTLTVYPRSGQRMWPIITETMTFLKFFQSRNPGIEPRQSRDFGIGKVVRDPGIRDPGIAIPTDRCCLPNDEGPGPPKYFFLEPPLL